MSMPCAVTRATLPITLCASHRIKLIGTVDGQFPDMGHHSEREMAGLWMHPIKLLDGFWMRFHDLDSVNVDTWILADDCVQEAGGNRFRYRHGLGHTPVTIDRRQTAPDDVPGLIVTYTLQNHDPLPRRVEIEWCARTELYPSWFALDTCFCKDGRDIGYWNEKSKTFVARDEDNPWFTAIFSEASTVQIRTGDLITPQGSGKGTCLSLLYRLDLPGNDSRVLRFFISGSCESQEEAEQNIRLLRDGQCFAEDKEARLEKALAFSRLSAQDPSWENAWDWIKIHLDWLVVDAGQYGKALAAGLPEYPWWFGCDNCYAIQGLLCVGQFELARQTLKLLADYSMKINGNGRIVHEITPFGLCPNPGNTQETAHFVTAIWHYWQASADRDFIEELLPVLRLSMRWLQSQDEDGDLLPSGYGITEIRGLNAEMIDTAAYTCQAWECFGDMLALCGYPVEAETAREMHRRIRTALNTILWDEDQSLFCDACASPAFVRQRLDQILASYHQKMGPGQREVFESMLAKKEQQQGEAGFLINRNWVIVTPMESGQAEEDKARRALANLHTAEQIGPWGAYLSAVEHESTMTISTGCMAVAQAKWGYPERALELLEKMLSTFGRSGPGMISEMSPDYGCAVQAWTAYALYVPVVRYFFGIQPTGETDSLVFHPCMPKKWRHAALRQVRLAGGYLDISYERSGSEDRFTLLTDQALHIQCRNHPGYECTAQNALKLEPGKESVVIYTRTEDQTDLTNRGKT